MTYEKAIQTIPCGRYRHFKGKPYEVIGIARHSETEEPKMWNETVTRDGVTYKRFTRIGT